MHQMHTDKAGQLEEHGFLVAAWIGENVSVKEVRLRLMEALTWVEGVGEVDVQHMGVLEQEGGE